jgi:hypothetical protein
MEAGIKKSGRGQPQSKTWRLLARSICRVSVLDCGCPLPLSAVAVGGVEMNGLLSPALSSRGGEGEDTPRFAIGAHF